MGQRFLSLAQGVYQSFSVPTLLRTLFAPWRQTIAPAGPNRNIKERWRGLIDNLVSRVVGFGMRSATLIAAVIETVVISVVGTALIIVWPAVPALVTLLFAKGLGLL